MGPWAHGAIYPMGANGLWAWARMGPNTPTTRLLLRRNFFVLMGNLLNPYTHMYQHVSVFRAIVKNKMFYNNTILVDSIVCVLPVMLNIRKFLYVTFITMFCCLKFDCFQMPEMCLHGLYICSVFFMHFRQVREFTNL